MHKSTWQEVTRITVTCEEMTSPHEVIQRWSTQFPFDADDAFKSLQQRGRRRIVVTVTQLSPLHLHFLLCACQQRSVMLTEIRSGTLMLWPEDNVQSEDIFRVFLAPTYEEVYEVHGEKELAHVLTHLDQGSFAIYRTGGKGVYIRHSDGGIRLQHEAGTCVGLIASFLSTSNDIAVSLTCSARQQPHVVPSYLAVEFADILAAQHIPSQTWKPSFHVTGLFAKHFDILGTLSERGFLYGGSITAPLGKMLLVTCTLNKSRAEETIALLVTTFDLLPSQIRYEREEQRACILLYHIDTYSFVSLLRLIRFNEMSTTVTSVPIVQLVQPEQPRQEESEQ